MSTNIAHEPETAHPETAGNGTAGRPAEPVLRTRLLTTEAEFDDIGPEWDALLERSEATVFQTFEWQRTWWKYFGRPGDLHILVFERDGRPEGIAPLYRTRERLLGLPVTTRLRFVGVGLSDYLTVIAPRGNEAAAAKALAAWLALNPRSWDVFDLEDVQESHPIFTLLPAELEAAGLPLYRYHGTVCPHIPLPESEAELTRQLGPSSGYNLKRKLKMLKNNFSHEVRLFKTPGDPIEEAMDDFAWIHGERWKSQGHPSAFDDPHHLAFHTEVCRKMAARDWLRLYILDVNGRPAGVSFSFNYRSTIYMYQSNAYGPPDVMRCSPGLIVRSIAMTDGIREGMKVFDFMRGNEPYKYREWDAHDARNWLLRTASPAPGGGPRFWLFLAAELLDKAAGRIRREYYDYRRYRLSGQDRELPPPAYAMQRLDILLKKTTGFASRHLRRDRPTQTADNDQSSDS